MTTFQPSKAFARKCAELNKRTRKIDAELDSALVALVDLKLVVADALDKLSRVEKLKIIKKVAA